MERPTLWIPARAAVPASGVEIFWSGVGPRVFESGTGEELAFGGTDPHLHVAVTSISLPAVALRAAALFKAHRLA